MEVITISWVFFSGVGYNYIKVAMHLIKWKDYQCSNAFRKGLRVTMINPLIL